MSSPPLTLSPRSIDAHKGHFGRVLLVGGSRGMSGSIALSALAALRTGSGLVSAMVPSVCLETVAGFHPGVMTIPAADTDGGFDLPAAIDIVDAADSVSAIGCGPGMGTSIGAIAVVERILAMRQTPRVLDADAINILAKTNWSDRINSDVVLTPHPGELQRLTQVSSQVRDGQIAAAKALAEQTGGVIVVKGGPTVVVCASDSWTNTNGNPGMATAGSGDLLTGVITSLLGQGLSTWDAARLGVWIHGRAGDLAAQQHTQIGMTCVEIAQSLGHSANEAVG